MSGVLVVGASNNPTRYAYKAVAALLGNEDEVILFGVKRGEVLGLPIINEWLDWKDIDTVTLYVNAQNQQDLQAKIIALQPRRVIFNPGTENPIFQELLVKQGIIAEEACTLVMIATKQF
jgi:uncharacterized protein